MITDVIGTTKNANMADLSELQIVEGASKLLNLHGSCEVLYLTAEFQPFSNQQKPDLFFSSSEKGIGHFIEFKLLKKSKLLEGYFQSVIEHKEFVRDSIRKPFVYTFSTNIKLSPNTITYLNTHDINAIDGINNEVELYNAILRLKML